MDHADHETPNDRTSAFSHAEELEDDAPPTTWRELMLERERAADRYRALKRRLLEER